MWFAVRRSFGAIFETGYSLLSTVDGSSGSSGGGTRSTNSVSRTRSNERRPSAREVELARFERMGSSMSSYPTPSAGGSGGHQSRR